MVGIIVLWLLRIAPPHAVPHGRNEGPLGWGRSRLLRLNTEVIGRGPVPGRYGPLPRVLPGSPLHRQLVRAIAAAYGGQP